METEDGNTRVIQDKDREAFEAWFLGDNPTMTDKRAVERSGDRYILMKTRCDWIAWQAARDFYAPKLTEAEAVSKITDFFRINCSISDRHMAEHAVEVLRRAGVRFKIPSDDQ